MKGTSLKRRSLVWVLSLVMILSLAPVSAFAAEDTASTGCTHQHDGSCGYVEAVAEAPCDKGCTDTDSDGVIDHAEDCAYTPAVEGQPCNHVHDENCGGLTAEEEPPAEEEAEEEEEPSVEEDPDEPEAVTALRARIDALPTGEAYLYPCGVAYGCLAAGLRRGRRPLSVEKSGGNFR